MSKLETNTIDTVSGTSTLQVGSTNTSTITLGVSGDTINVPSGVTIANSGTATGFGGDNTPMFSAYKASDQTSLAANQYNKITFTTEEFDPDSAYDASNSKFVAPSAGKYFFSTLMRVYPSSGVVGMSPGFYKNGSLVRYNKQYNEDNQSVEHQIIMDLAQNDYVEVYLYVHTYTSTVSGGQNSNIFQGFKLIS